MNDKEIMKIALLEAKKASRVGEVPIGAVLTLGDKILATTYNKRESTKDVTAHAEILAMRIACESLNSWRLNNTNIYVTLEPCPMCAGAIVNARIKKLVYGASDNKHGAIHSRLGIPFDKNFNYGLETIGGILEEKCSKILVEFFKDKR